MLPTFPAYQAYSNDNSTVLSSILVFSLVHQSFEGSISALNLLRTSLPNFITVYGQHCPCVHVYTQIHRN
jgi:hypothetical protein